jgi:hypothetical protein
MPKSISRYDPPRHYEIECAGGRKYIIFNASHFGHPPNCPPGKWFFEPLPMRSPLQVGEPFDTTEAAEQGAWDWDGRLNL